MLHHGLERQITELVEVEVQALGFSLWGLQMPPSEKRRVIRIYIDGPEGVNIDDCAQVSRQLDLMLEAEEVMPGAFTLEVSSPGLERRFFTLNQLGNYVNRTIDALLTETMEGRRHFKGPLLSVEADGFTMECNGAKYSLPWDAVKEVKLVHEF